MSENKEAVNEYIARLDGAVAAGNATEPSHYPALKALLEELKGGTTATTNPKQIECGAPDFAVSLNSPHGPLSIGYVEAKDLGRSLDEAERSDQLKRYRTLPNLILTDYLDFRWYVDGKLRMQGRLGKLDRGKVTLDEDGADAAIALIAEFMEHSPQPIRKPRDLALQMARLTHFIREIIVEAFEKDQVSTALLELRAAFEDTLIPDLKTPQFADMFAQTLAYGLFAARARHNESEGRFKRLSAASEIPRTNPFLRKLFATITGPDLDDEPFAGFVGDLTQLLADTDLASVLADFGKRTRLADPVMHFYEAFLAAYDPRMREMRGVYYTPEPVVSYIVRSVNSVLKEHFGCPDGVADTSEVEYPRRENGGANGERVPRVLILDPACGTGSFLYAVIDLIRKAFMHQGNAGKWSAFVREKLLPRLFGFELLMAPHALAHLKLGMQLAGQDLPEEQRADWSYDFEGDERLGIYLTNTLEEAQERSDILFGRWIAEEANAASEIKRDLPIMVVLGNPPYSNFGKMNRGEWILGLLEDYKRNLRETKLNLNDDFIKFVRFGQWRIDQTGSGVLAFITNRTYLDGITHRRMRRSLMDTFTDIYILDLHGDSRKGEVAPDGGPDKNVFDIQQGVAIGIFVKEDGGEGQARVHHADMWGTRESKYAELSENDLATTKWNELDPRPEEYFFIPRDLSAESEYMSLPAMEDVLPTRSSGIETKRDKIAVGYTRDQLKAVVEAFAKLDPASIRAKYDLPADGRDWSIEWAGAHAREILDRPEVLAPILYRPFDERWTVLDDRSKGFVAYPRFDVMRHMKRDNLGLILTRQVSGPAFHHVLATRRPVDRNTLSLQTREANYLMPLYLYASEQEVTSGLYTADDRRPNIASSFIADFESRLGLTFSPDGRGDLHHTFGPEDIFNYIYAVLHAPEYGSRYAEFLRTSFPRVPVTANLDLFRALAALGGELVSLHLLESPALAIPITRFPVPGPNIVESSHPRYLAPGEPEPLTGEPLKTGRVYLNKDRRKSSTRGQYFEGIHPEVWELHIGGFQVCHKWLKDKKGKRLTLDDLAQYEKILVALSETIRVVAEIDSVVPGWPIE